jgi:hypothetical protein
MDFDRSSRRGIKTGRPPVTPSSGAAGREPEALGRLRFPVARTVEHQWKCVPVDLLVADLAHDEHVIVGNRAGYDLALNRSQRTVEKG